MKVKEIIKKIDTLVKEGYEKKDECLDLINGLKTSSKLIEFIREFVGFEGLLAFEHGYMVILSKYGKIWGVDQYNLLSIKGNIPISKLDVDTLRCVCQNICNYYFYCYYKA